MYRSQNKEEVMKNIKSISLTLFCITLLTLVGCQKQETSNGTSVTATTNAQEKTIAAYSKEERDLGALLATCSHDWNKLVSASSEVTDIKLIAVGMVGRECLSISNVSSLKQILSAYKENLESKTINWNELAKTILTTESL
jgi:hypothetical protein